MNPTISTSLFIISLSFFLLYSSATAFNITQILSQKSDFSNFNNLLTQTQLASEINSRETITVLAVDNSAIGAIPSEPTDVMKNILALHVILDYYDTQKLQKLSNKTTLLTTLFQTSGSAKGDLGFLNVTVSSNGVAFGSSVKGAPIDSKLVGSVVAQPYNISVLQISSPVIPQGIDAVKANSSSTPIASPPSSASSPAGAPPKKGPTKGPSASPSKAPSPKTAKAPAISNNTAAAPSESPASNATASDAPASDAPVSSDAPKSSPPSPVAADAPGPGGAGEADAPAGTTTKKKSSGARVTVGMFISVVTCVVASSWFAF